MGPPAARRAVAYPAVALVSLDVAAAVLTGLVALFFGRTWRRTDDSLHLLFGVGFGLIALSFLAVSTSQFDLARPGEDWDAMRIAGQTGGALVLVFAYLSARRSGTARPWQVLGWLVAAALALFAGLYWAAPPYAALPTLYESFATAHAVQFAAYIGCAVMAFAGYRAAPSTDRALVPAAYLAWAFSKYTWFAIDVTGSEVVVPLVFAWRFAAIGLLLLAVALPARRSREVQRAAT